MLVLLSWLVWFVVVALLVRSSHLPPAQCTCALPCHMERLQDQEHTDDDQQLFFLLLVVFGSLVFLLFIVLSVSAVFYAVALLVVSVV